MSTELVRDSGEQTKIRTDADWMDDGTGGRGELQFPVEI